MSGVLLERSIDRTKDSISFVVGNGESRHGFELNLIASYDNWACNLSALDYDSTRAVAADRYIVSQLLNADYNKEIITRGFNSGYFEGSSNVKFFPNLPYEGDHKYDQPLHWGTGLYAALMACQLDVKMIVLLGFDLYGSVDDPGKINNIYKNREGYNDANSRAVDPRHWIYQFTKLFKLYPQTNFVFIKRENYPRAPWEEFQNVYFDSYENLHQFIKDLN